MLGFNSVIAGPLLAFVVAMFASSVSASGLSENILYTFTGHTDGGRPSGELARDVAGNLYGTTTDGGIPNAMGGYGVVFELSPIAGGGWTEKVLYAFAGGNDGEAPTGGVVFDAAGNMYGTTARGGNGAGTIFELSPTAGGGWTEQIIYRFRSGYHSAAPNGGLTIDSSGNLFGTTATGGAENLGTVFELSRVASGGWSWKVILTGTQARGGVFFGKVVFDSAHNLYATAANGGLFNAGAIYRLRATANDWRSAVIYTFLGGADGSGPVTEVTVLASGHLFGTTYGGGSFGYGTAFELILNSDGTWVKNTIYTFGSTPADARSPEAPLTIQRDHLLGTSLDGGTAGGGTLFELLKSAGAWEEKVLYSFSNSGGVGGPASGIILGGDNLYGLGHGGPRVSPWGGVYELSPD